MFCNFCKGIFLCCECKLTAAKLKINLKSLAYESRVNRKEAAKVEDRVDLDEHRRGKLRDESRITQWLYAFIRGVPRSKLEAKTHTDWYHMSLLKKRVREKAKRFNINMESFDEWFET